MTTRRASKWDVPPRRGEFDWILGEIREQVAQTPPRPPEGPPRREVVHINIDLTPAPAPPKRRARRWWSALFWLLALMALAHAEPPSYEHWNDTNGWHGQTRQEGRTTDWDAYGPRGEQKHCHRYYVGDQAYTSCN